MKYEKLSDALEEIRDSYIAEACQRKQKPFPWIPTVAAVLALVIATGFAGKLLTGRNESTQPQKGSVGTHSPHQNYLVAAPAYPQVAPYPSDYEETGYDAWRADQQALHNQPEGYADNLQSYFSHMIPALLTDSQQKNPVFSPVNIYMALAMLAETTAGESRQQILDLMKVDSLETLRTQAGHVWTAHYNNDTLSTSILGSSLWLHEDIAYNEATVDTLAKHYYASVFRGKLGTDEMNAALQSWLSEQTGGLLQDQAQNTKLAPNSTLALATTVLYQVQWLDEFRAEANTQGTFHGDSDSTETFMNRQLSYGPYYWSDSFGAVHLPLEDGSRMWLLLPDEGQTPESILENGEVSRFFSSEKNEKTVIVNLSLPKFDVCFETDLVKKLQALGITAVFQPETADFSPILPQADGGYVDQVKHATRVSIDEKGVTAAAFTVIDRCGAAMPPKDEVDFTLDRPFLFYIESRDGLPLFTGVVHEP